MIVYNHYNYCNHFTPERAAKGSSLEGPKKEWDAKHPTLSTGRRDGRSSIDLPSSRPVQQLTQLPLKVVYSESESESSSNSRLRRSSNLNLLFKDVLIPY